MAKPYKRAELLEAIRDACGRSTSHATPDVVSNAPVAHRHRVLLAEDSPINQEVAVGLLEMQGYHVTVVDNGRQAVETCEVDQFDLILMDVEMPEMDGWEATLALREREATRGSYTPIVALTAHDVEDIRDRCREVGMDACVSKPIQPQELFQAMTEVTAQRQPT